MSEPNLTLHYRAPRSSAVGRGLFRGTSSMTSLLAWRNLRNDPIRFAATLIGIIFSVALMTVQASLLDGFSSTAAGLVDHAGADLWIMSRGTTNVDQSVVLPERDLYMALATPGVAAASRAIVRFVDWRKPDGGTQLVIVVGSSVRSGMALPWNVVQGSVASLSEPDAIMIDRLYAEKLGITHIGQEIEIRSRRAHVTGLTSGIRTFTQAPYVFTSYNTALKLSDLLDGEASYILIRLAPGASAQDVQARLQRDVPNAEVITADAFSKRTVSYWIGSTGAGLSLALGCALSAIVGITVVAQTLYTATIERIAEYATLSAMGAPSRYLYEIVVKQAMIAGGIGCACSLLIAFVISTLARNGPVALQLSGGLSLIIIVFTMSMCAFASLLAVRRLSAIDPTSVFK